MKIIDTTTYFEEKLMMDLRLNILNSHVDKGDDPRLMARFVYKVIMKENPKTHYIVGAFLQKISIMVYLT